jgi:hypothetical protein
MEILSNPIIVPIVLSVLAVGYGLFKRDLIPDKKQLGKLDEKYIWVFVAIIWIIYFAYLVI